MTTLQPTLPRPSITTSVVTNNQRFNRWGSNRYRGNCDGRIFADLVLRYGATSVADPMMGSGTTRDCIADLNQSGASINYWGGDLNQGFNLVEDEIPGKFDFVWIHPPYWNLIRYSYRDGDLSNTASYEEFLAKLEQCLSKCYEALNPGGRLAILIGDLHRDGSYIPVCRDVMNLEGKLGELRAVIVNEQKNCWSDIIPMKNRILPVDGIRVRHDCCIVFKKQPGQ